MRFFSRDTYQVQHYETKNSSPRPQSPTKSSTSTLLQSAGGEITSARGELIAISRPASAPKASQASPKPYNSLLTERAGENDFAITKSCISDTSSQSASSRKSTSRRSLPNSVVQQQRLLDQELFTFDVFGSTSPFVPATLLSPQMSSTSQPSTSTQCSSPRRHFSPVLHTTRVESTCGSIGVQPPDGNASSLRNDKASSSSRSEPAPLNDPSGTQSLQADVLHSTEVIMIDDTSDCSRSVAAVSPTSRRTIDETVYLTPETSKSRCLSTAIDATILSVDGLQPAAGLSASAEQAAENVFTTHRRNMEIIRKERDGWQELCQRLIAEVESGFSSNACNKCHLSQDGVERAVAQRLLIEDRNLLGGFNEANNSSWESGSNDQAKAGASVEHQQFAADNALLQDELRDLRIRLESKQKDCDEERAKAERLESKCQLQSTALNEQKHEIEKYNREARDVDVKLELYARERENKGKHLLAAFSCIPISLGVCSTPTTSDPDTVGHF